MKASMISTARTLRDERGFSLVELIITMLIFVVVIAATSTVFTSLLSQFKQQSKIAETNIEGVVGLDILRRDLSHGGFGLPWAMGGGLYREAEAEAGQTFWVDRDLNDGRPNNPARGTDPGDPSCNPPGAFRTLNNTGIHNSDPAANGGVIGQMANSSADVLAIKATNVAMNRAAQRWTYVNRWGTAGRFDQLNIKGWPTGEDNFVAGDQVTAIWPNPTSATNQRQWRGTYTTFGNVVSLAPIVGSSDIYVVYGIDDTRGPRMPFNRADYYVKRPVRGTPGRCAPNTGILYKATLNQSDGMHTELPLLDCVADFQVTFALDTNGDGTVDGFSDDISNLTAADIRAQVKEVRVYIVAHEGQLDPKNDFSINNTRTGLSTIEVAGAVSRAVNFVNLKNLVGTVSGDANHYRFYRWKLYTIITKPTNLR